MSVGLSAAPALGVATAAVPLVWPACPPARRRLLRSVSATRGGAVQRVAVGSLARVWRARAARLRGRWLPASPGLLRSPVVGPLALGVVAGTAAAWLLTAPLLAALCPALALWTRHRARLTQRRRGLVARRAEVTELCMVLRSELVAGRSARDALAEAAACCPDLQRTLLADLRYGADPAVVLGRFGAEPGRDGLVALAACWRLAGATGAGMVRVVGRLEQALRAEQADRAEVAAELGGVRMTAALLAGLPLLAIALGGMVGVDPLHILLDTPLGAVCALIGVGLELAGVAWVDRIASHAETQI